MALAPDPTNEPWVPADHFGSRLALLRNHLGWNVKEAADLCGINDQSWRNWEAGKLPRDLLTTVHQIASVTGCSEKWLLVGNQNWKYMTRPDLRICHDGTPGESEARHPTRGRQRRVPVADRHLIAVPDPED